MSVESNAVKTTAKTAIKDRYLRLVASSVLIIFAWILCYNLSALSVAIIGSFGAVSLFVLMLIFLILPLGLGLLRVIWRALFEAEDNLISVFYWFGEKSLYLRALKLIWLFFIRAVIWLLLLNIPSLILGFLSHGFIFELLNRSAPVWTANFGYFSVILRNVSFVLVFFFMLKFYMAPLLMIADENMDVNEAMYISAIISKKSAVDFIGLAVSCFLWIIASMFVLPLPFTLPYLLSFYGVHTRFAVTEYNLHISETATRLEGFI